MKTRHFVWIVISLALLLAFAHTGLPRRLVRLRQAGAERIAAEKERQAQEVEALRLRQQEELAEARGGGMDAFLKDPELSVTQMLCQAAAQLVPEWEPDVSVEDFTDFELALHVPPGPLSAPMRAFLKAYLPTFGPYLANIRLITGGGTFGEIDRVELAQAERWLDNDEWLAWVITGYWHGGEDPAEESEDIRPTPEDFEFDVEWTLGTDGEPTIRISRTSKGVLAMLDAETDGMSAEGPPGGPSEASLDPVAAAREFYVYHNEFYRLDDTLPRIKEFVTPEFYAAMDTCRQEGTVIDIDPWLHAQDGGLSSPIDFRLVRQTGDVAMVHMVYDFTLNETTVCTTALRFVRSAEDSRWRLDELYGREGWPLVRIQEYEDVEEE